MQHLAKPILLMTVTGLLYGCGAGTNTVAFSSADMVQSSGGLVDPGVPVSPGAAPAVDANIVIPAAVDFDKYISPNFNISANSTWEASFSYELDDGGAPGLEPGSQEGSLTFAISNLSTLSLAAVSMGEDYFGTGGESQIAGFGFSFAGANDFATPYQTTAPIGRRWVWVEYDLPSTDELGDPVANFTVYHSDSASKPATPTLAMAVDLSTELSLPITEELQELGATSSVYLFYANDDVTTDLTVYSDYAFTAHTAVLAD